MDKKEKLSEEITKKMKAFNRKLHVRAIGMQGCVFGNRIGYHRSSDGAFIVETHQLDNDNVITREYLDKNHFVSSEQTEAMTSSIVELCDQIYELGNDIDNGFDRTKDQSQEIGRQISKELSGVSGTISYYYDLLREGRV